MLRQNSVQTEISSGMPCKTTARHGSLLTRVCARITSWSSLLRLRTVMREENLRADREIAFNAVQQIMSALQYVPEELRADNDFVLAAVQQDTRSELSADNG